jgi:hypothetical protein
MVAVWATYDGVQVRHLCTFAMLAVVPARAINILGQEVMPPRTVDFIHTG